MKKTILTVFTLFFCFTLILAQQPKKPNASEIYESITKLNFLGSVLYVAAHPDDENTRLISYMSNHVKARTGYLSVTRGDGGQNLIGPEIRELLKSMKKRVKRGQYFFAITGTLGEPRFRLL